MKRVVPMGKGPAVLMFAMISPFGIAVFLCFILDAPFLVTLILFILFGFLFFLANKFAKQQAKINLVEICDTEVAITIDGKLESFGYSKIKDFKLVEDEGLFKNGIYVILTDEALEWRLASKANYAMQNRYKKLGTIAVIPTLASSMPIENVYSTLKKQLETYRNSHQAETHVDDIDDDPVADFIDDVDEILDAIEDGCAEGERIANRITKIFKL